MTDNNKNANTAPEEVKPVDTPNAAMDAYAAHLTKTSGGMGGWKTSALPPSQRDVAASMGKIEKDKG